jgi:hypothetical protein
MSKYRKPMVSLSNHPKSLGDPPNLLARGIGVAMLRLAAILAIFSALISVSSADQAYLGEKEVRDLITGNTVHGQGLQRGTRFQSFYDLNGR